MVISSPIKGKSKPGAIKEKDTIKKKYAIVLSVLLVCAALLSGCETKPALAEIALPDELQTIELPLGESIAVDLTKTFTHTEATEEQKAAAVEQAGLRWISAEESIVQVEAGTGSAILHAVGLGEAVVEVLGTKETLSASIIVIVVDPIVPLTGIEVPQDLFAGLTGHSEEEEEQPEVSVIEVKVTPADATDIAMEFASSDEAVVTVDSEGVLTPVAEGQAIITTTVTGLDDDRQPVRFTAETAVTVGIKATSIGLAATEGWIYVGGAHQLAPYTLPAGAAEHTYSFTSSDEAVATVSDTGYITGIGAGTATIAVTSETDSDLSLEYTITVNVYVAPRGANTGSGTSGGGTTGGGSTGAGSDNNAGETTGGGTGGGETPSGGDSGGGETPQPPPTDDNHIEGTPMPPGDPWGGGTVGGD